MRCPQRFVSSKFYRELKSERLDDLHKTKNQKKLKNKSNETFFRSDEDSKFNQQNSFERSKYALNILV